MRLSFFYSLVATCLLTISLSSPALCQQNQEEDNGGWWVLLEKDGVTFSVQRVNCETIPGKLPLHYSMLKIENLDNTAKNLSFNFGLAYKEGCSGCTDASEHHVDMVIRENEILTGDCSFKDHHLTRLIVNPNLPKGWEFIGEQISNLSVH